MWPVANHFELKKLSFIKISSDRISADAKFLVTSDKNKRKKLSYGEVRESGADWVWGRGSMCPTNFFFTPYFICKNNRISFVKISVKSRSV